MKNYEFKHTRAGVKVFLEDKHIKTIPEKYKGIFCNISITTDKKRLSLKERFSLEYILFINELKSNNKYVYELIEKSKPIKTALVNVMNSGIRYELIFENKIRININRDLYLLFEDKDPDKYLNY